jgi:RNA polymerase sigma-70 factor (ECF subfamily)
VGVEACVREVNGVPALLAWSGSALVGVLVPEIADRRVTAVRIVADPDKLRFLATQVARLSR